MRRFFLIIRDCYVYFLIVLNYISVVCIFLMALWVFADVAGRFLFNHPIPGTTELVECAIITIVFLGLPYATHKNRNIRTVLIIERLPLAAQKWSEIIGYLLFIVIFSLMCFYSFQAGMQSWKTREYVGILLKVPLYPSRFTVVLGSGLIVIEAVVNVVVRLRSLMQQVKE